MTEDCSSYFLFSIWLVCVSNTVGTYVSISMSSDSVSINYFPNSSVIRQKGESQNRCFRKTKYSKFSDKQTFLTPWYARHASVSQRLGSMLISINGIRLAKRHLTCSYNLKWLLISNLIFWTPGIFKLISAHCCVSCRNQPFVLPSKTNDRFLYEMQHWNELG